MSLPNLPMCFSWFFYCTSSDCFRCSWNCFFLYTLKCHGLRAIVYVREEGKEREERGLQRRFRPVQFRASRVNMRLQSHFSLEPRVRRFDRASILPTLPHSHLFTALVNHTMKPDPPSRGFAHLDTFGEMRANKISSANRRSEKSTC